MVSWQKILIIRIYQPAHDDKLSIYMSVHRMYMCIDFQMCIYLYKHVHTMSVRGTDMFVIFWFGTDMSVHIWKCTDVYIPCTDTPLWHGTVWRMWQTLYRHGIYMSVHCFARWSGIRIPDVVCTYWYVPLHTGTYFQEVKLFSDPVRKSLERWDKGCTSSMHGIQCD